MAKIAVLFGALLIGLGLIGYFGDTGTANGPDGTNAEVAGTADGSTDDAPDGVANESSKKSPSLTAFIPAGFGILILIFGLIALNDRYRMHAMHGAVLFGLFGFLAGLVRGLMTLGKLMFGAGDEVNIRAMIFVWLMALLCAVFVVMCVQSFRNARKQRQAAESPSDSTTAS